MEFGVLKLTNCLQSCIFVRPSNLVGDPALSYSEWSGHQGPAIV